MSVARRGFKNNSSIFLLAFKLVSVLRYQSPWRLVKLKMWCVVDCFIVGRSKHFQLNKYQVRRCVSFLYLPHFCRRRAEILRFNKCLVYCGAHTHLQGVGFCRRSHKCARHPQFGLLTCAMGSHWHVFGHRARRYNTSQVSTKRLVSRGAFAGTLALDLAAWDPPPLNFKNKLSPSVARDS